MRHQSRKADSPEIRRSAFTLRDSDQPDVVRIADETAPLADLYHSLIRMSWARFITIFVAMFFLLNLIFACLYVLDEGGLNMPEPSHGARLINAFFFSVHTIATVGYGNIYPTDLYTNVVVVIEITVGLLFFALGSGLTFSRFSRPTARVLFSNTAVVAPFQGAQTLMLRAANLRHNFIFEANVHCSLLRLETIDGKEMRRFYDLELQRQSTPVFALTWLIMHGIDESSPLFGLDQNAFEAGGDEIVVLLRGFDSSVAQSIQARWAYGPGDVLWQHEFADVLSSDENGRASVDFTRFHDVIPLPRTAHNEETASR